VFPNPVSLKNTGGTQWKKNPLKRICLEQILSCIDGNAFNLANAYKASGGFCALRCGDSNGPAEWDVPT
jgi:hypothetical protein